MKRDLRFVGRIVIATALLCEAGAAAAARQRATSEEEPAAVAPFEVIHAVRVHGNHVTPEAEVIAASGLVAGERFEPEMLATARRRLLDTGRFQDVQLLKRLASIADPSLVLIVIIINEHPVRILPGAPGEPPRVVRRRFWRQLMVLPVLSGEDGYGLTYGARLAWPGVAGARSRLSFPLTWGGTKQAGAELDRTFPEGPVSRLVGGVALVRRRNLFFDEEDERRRVWARAERQIGVLRLGGTVARERVSFGASADDLTRAGADVLVDTRVDPMLSRQAVLARASWERVLLDGQEAIDRSRFEVRGYLGLIGQAVLIARAERETASRAQPAYLKPLAGGWSNLRGFRAGTLAGDTLVAGSLDLRLPLSATLARAKVGLSLFVDSATAYDRGEPFDTGAFRTGAGGGVWLSAPLFRIELSVAHGNGAGTRAHFDAGLTF